MTTTESENLETARLYLRAIEDRVGFHELASFFTPDVVQREYPNQLVQQGAERDLQQLREAAERGRHVITSQHYEVRNALANEDWVALEVTWIAVVAVPVGAIPAGGEMRANFGVFLQFRDGKIARQHNYDCFDPF
ncbi:MAG TPA: nuclear transport factor 2 family protein [Pyrinomonadaceae bacterium]